MTSHDNERIKRLEKRMNWLRTRTYKGGDKDLSFDKAEASALEWGIDIIERYLKVKDETCRHNYEYVDKITDNVQFKMLGLLFHCTKCLKFEFRTFTDIAAELAELRKEVEKSEKEQEKLPRD